MARHRPGLRPSRIPDPDRAVVARADDAIARRPEADVVTRASADRAARASGGPPSTLQTLVTPSRPPVANRRPSRLNAAVCSCRPLTVEAASAAPRRSRPRAGSGRRCRRRGCWLPSGLNATSVAGGPATVQDLPCAAAGRVPEPDSCRPRRHSTTRPPSASEVDAEHRRPRGRRGDAAARCRRRRARGPCRRRAPRRRADRQRRTQRSGRVWPCSWNSTSRRGRATRP